MIFYNFRSYAEALVSSSDSSSKPTAASLRTDGSELPQQVLESLFNIPKSSKHDPGAMSWRNVVKQLESFAQKRVQLVPSGFIAQELKTQGILILSCLAFYCLETGIDSVYTFYQGGGCGGNCIPLVSSLFCVCLSLSIS